MTYSAKRHRSVVFAMVLLVLLAGCGHRPLAKSAAKHGAGHSPTQAPSPLKTPAGGHKGKLIPLKKTPAPPRSSTKQSARPAQVVYFKVVRPPRCEVAKSGTSPGSPAVDIQLAWKFSGTDTVAFSDDEPNYYDKHGHRAGKLGVFPAVDTVTMEFPCNDGAETTHSYTIDNMTGAPHVKRTIKYTLP